MVAEPACTLKKRPPVATMLTPDVARLTLFEARSSADGRAPAFVSQRRRMSRARTRARTLLEQPFRWFAVASVVASVAQHPLRRQWVDSRFGDYSIVREIGRGGAEARFEAVRDDDE